MTPPLAVHAEPAGKKPRSVLVDNLFVFAMLLVLLGHSDVVDSYRTMWLYRWIHSFHMPLFFAISGYLLMLTRNITLSPKLFFQKKVTRLLIPLVVVTTIGFLLKASIGSVADRPVGFDLNSYLHCFLYPHDNPVLFLWFLTVLFEIQIVMYIFYRTLVDRASQIVGWLIPICLVGFYLFPSIELLDISHLIYYVAFFVLGILFHRHESKVIRSLHLDSVCSMLILGLLSVSSPYVIDYLPNYFAPAWALLGIFFSVSLMLNLQKKDIKIFPGLRKYTYTIYLLSWFPQSCFRTVIMPHVDFSYWPLIAIFSFASAVVIPYGIGVFVNRYVKDGILSRFIHTSIGLS